MFDFVNCKKKYLDIFVFITLICSSHFNCSSIYIPRNVLYFVISIDMSVLISE